MSESWLLAAKHSFYKVLPETLTSRLQPNSAQDWHATDDCRLLYQRDGNTNDEHLIDSAGGMHTYQSEREGRGGGERGRYYLWSCGAHNRHLVAGRGSRQGK